jgi:hypothetical protein
VQTPLVEEVALATPLVEEVALATPLVEEVALATVTRPREREACKRFRDAHARAPRVCWRNASASTPMAQDASV